MPPCGDQGGRPPALRALSHDNPHLPLYGGAVCAGMYVHCCSILLTTVVSLFWPQGYGTHDAMPTYMGSTYTHTASRARELVLKEC